MVRAASVLARALRKTQEAELEIAEMKMPRLSFGVMRMDRIRKEKKIRGTACIRCFGDKCREVD